MHSQGERCLFMQHYLSFPGKVLGDRSVLYKYSNPNLIAVASTNDKRFELHISLIDGVSGSLVYSGKHSRAQTPINLVLCENWLTVNIPLFSKIIQILSILTGTSGIFYPVVYKPTT